MKATTRFERWSPWIVIVTSFVLWEFFARVLGIRPFILPKPTDIVASMIRWWAPLQMHSIHTLTTTITGFAVAIILGLLIGLLIGYSRVAYHALYPLLIAFNSIPKAALVPILVIWFGIGSVPAVITACLISFFPIAANVATGLATVEPELEDVLHSLGAGRRQLFIKVGLPSVMPYFFASLKVAITLAFVGSIISETIASNRGVGYLMVSASGRFDVPLVFAGLTVVAAMGIVLYGGFAIVERRVTSWAYR